MDVFIGTNRVLFALFDRFDNKSSVNSLKTSVLTLTRCLNACPDGSRLFKWDRHARCDNNKYLNLYVCILNYKLIGIEHDTLLRGSKLSFLKQIHFVHILI